jgi:hypothetical protein
MREFLVITASIIVANILLEILGLAFHFAGKCAGKLIARAIPKPEPIIEPATKPDGAFFSWLQHK